jgi:hypothetical protein
MWGHEHRFLFFVTCLPLHPFALTTAMLAAIIAAAAPRTIMEDLFTASARTVTVRARGAVLGVQIIFLWTALTLEKQRKHGAI